MTLQRRRLLLVSVVLGLGGLGVAVGWVRWTGGSEAFGVFRRVSWLHASLLLAITACFVVTRFIRWQFLLRRAELPIPTRDSLRTYLASLAGTATPGYVGEVIRCAFLRRHFGAPLRLTLLCLLIERLLDVGVLALIGSACANAWLPRGLMIAAVVGAYVLIRLSVRAAAWMEIPRESLSALTKPGTLLMAAAGSAVVWLPVTLGLQFAAAGLDLHLPTLESMRVYTSSTLFGALTLMPAGFGATGSAEIVQLEKFGLALPSAVAVVTLFRALTTGACLSLGAIFLLIELRHGKGSPESAANEHFNALAGEYNAQFKPHVWNYLLERRVGFISGALPKPAAAGLGLDLGCGLGLQGQAMGKLGYRIVGIDPSLELLRHGRREGLTTAVGDALALPFADESLRFVYAVGVLHHLGGRAAQEAACREIARVLAPGGVLVVQETNTRNPLFRFYMGYVFPILSRIDEGTEHWIEPDRWARIDSLELVNLHYFTFLPDFIPQAWMPPFLALQDRLEKGRWKPYSVHYQAVLRKR